MIARADLAATGWDFAELDGAGIADLLVGQDFLFTEPKTVTNSGDTVADLYPDPVDTVVTRSIEVPEGVRVATLDADWGRRRRPPRATCATPTSCEADQFPHFRTYR